MAPRAVIETARMRLRPFTLDDGEAHARLYADPDVTRWIADGPFLGPAAAERSARAVRWFVDHWETHGFGVWAVEDQARESVIGQCGLNTLATGEVEILWALERAAWGAGRATEAARAALAYGFEVVGLTRIVALARPANTPSRRVMEKLGMGHVGEVAIYGAPAVVYAVERPPTAATASAR